LRPHPARPLLVVDVPLLAANGQARFGDGLNLPGARTAAGISSRTLVRYAERGWVTPARVLPSGHCRCSLEDVRRQLDALRDQDTD